MKRLFRIAIAALIASALLASGEAVADEQGRGRDRGRDGDRSEQQGRGQRHDRDDRQDRGQDRDYRGYRDDRGPRRGGPGDDGPPDVYGYPGPPTYARRLPPRGYGVRRGGQVPPQYREAVVPDYRSHRLRPPPPGFAWVRMGDRYALVSRATGQIFDVIGD
jgi:Ni/Co efflux regulator RcnB